LDLVLARVVEAIGETKYAEDLHVENLLDDHLLVVAGARSPWATRRKINLAELADASWIIPANSWNSLRVAEAFASIGMKMPVVTVDTFSLALRTELLATGRFVSAVPASTLHHDSQDASLKVLPVQLPNKPWPVAMITLKNRTLSPVAQRFTDCARVAAKAISLRHTRKGSS
jgi:DNA-binding transcriptional LysR family regulator